MASGKKMYFRHSFNAFEDEKIQLAVDKLGYQGYAYYFILLEILAKSCENEIKNPITIHQQTLRSVWRKQSKSCIKVVEKLQESGLFVATFNKSFIEFDIPNLSKYLGKYESKSCSNSSNKRKEKKRKESKVKETKKNDFDFSKIYSEYPRKEGKTKGFEKCNKIIKTENQFNNLMLSVKNYSKKCKEEETEKKYIKQFSSFMGCWEDYLDYIPIKKNPNILSFDDLVKMSTTTEQ